MVFFFILLKFFQVCLLMIGKTRSLSTLQQKCTTFPIEDAVAWIDEHCDRPFLHAVVASDYRFLYRGISNTAAVDLQALQPSLQNELPDLLQFETYGSSAALAFFQRLEEVLTANGNPLRPSCGHLATTSVRDASQWGSYAASVWPMSRKEQPLLESDVTDSKSTQRNGNYAWFRDHGLFYPRSTGPLFLSSKEERGSTRNEFFNDSVLRSIVFDGINCEEDDTLADALRQEACEILFTARPYLAIPALYDEALRRLLQSSFLI